MARVCIRRQGGNARRNAEPVHWSPGNDLRLELVSSTKLCFTFTWVGITTIYLASVVSLAKFAMRLDAFGIIIWQRPVNQQARLVKLYARKKNPALGP